ncbi:SWIM zinc finger family protein [Brachybacterium sp. 107]|uniref:SWIM zinc finger family protein n=1 Tax=Brachybacterium sp. 107 TaxID=3457736 RepID=UPI004034E8DB
MSIKLVSRRGAIGKGWHAAALRDAAERLLGVGRSGSGRADARAGRVQWLDVEAGIARGDVLDADGELYQARIDLPVYSPSDREVFLQVVRARPELPARLAAGDYPQEIEGALAPHEISLLPRDASELSHDCSCLDWPGPCRHVAALVYVLVEAVDEHPVHLVTLRGLTLEDLIAPRESTGARNLSGPADAADADGTDDDDDGSSPGPAPTPAPYDPARTDPSLLTAAIGAEPARIIAEFYGSRAPVAPEPPETSEPPEPADLPDDLARPDNPTTPDVLE